LESPGFFYWGAGRLAVAVVAAVVTAVVASIAAVVAAVVTSVAAVVTSVAAVVTSVASVVTSVAAVVASVMASIIADAILAGRIRRLRYERFLRGSLIEVCGSGHSRLRGLALLRHGQLGDRDGGRRLRDLRIGHGYRDAERDKRSQRNA